MDVNDVNQEPMTLRLTASRTTVKCPTPGRAGRGFLTNLHRRDQQDDKCPTNALGGGGGGWEGWAHLELTELLLYSLARIRARAQEVKTALPTNRFARI